MVFLATHFAQIYWGETRGTMSDDRRLERSTGKSRLPTAAHGLILPDVNAC